MKMLNGGQLGLYWGLDSFSLVEVSKGQPTQTATVPFDAPLDPGQAAQDIPQELRIATHLQRILKERGITSKKISLSLAAKDVIFRTFIIPWMPLEEIRNVIEFEVTKYIPIKLEDLSYTFHPVLSTEKNQKSFLIVFAAVRKNVLEKNMQILANCGLQIENVEPGPVSLGRALQIKGHIPRHQSAALIELGKTQGQIIVIEQEVIQFVREFSAPEELSTETQSKLFNDIRVSFDFYKRQNPKGKIDRVVLLSVTDQSALAKKLSDEIGIPASSVAVNQILAAAQNPDLGQLSAFGMAARPKKFSTKNLDLSAKSAQLRASGQMFLKTDYTTTAGILAACALIVTGTIFFAGKMVIGNNQKLAELHTREGVFTSSTAEQIKEMKAGKTETLTSYKSVRTDSQISQYIAHTPMLLPAGTWLKDFKIEYNDALVTNPDTGENELKTSVQLSLDGYAYTENTNEQFRLVNSLVTRFKDDETFKTLFTDIQLANVTQQTLEGFPVTSFRVSCK